MAGSHSSCQDLSVAGKRKGLAGGRSGLWFEFHRVLAELKPRWVVIENVTGLLSSGERRDFAVVVQGLADLGYLSAWRVFDAQYAGVAQRRRRVFIVGHLRDGRAAEVLFESTGRAWDPPPSREKRTGIADTLGTSANRISGTWGDLAPTKSFKRRGGFGWSESEEMTGTLESEGGSHQGGPERIPLIAGALKARQGGPDDNDAQAGHIIAQQVQWASGGGKILNDTAQALRSGAEHNYQFVADPQLGVRRLTPTECERLQGFPDGHTAVNGMSGLPMSDSARYRMLGNAIAVPCAEWIGWRIMAVEAT